MKRTLTDKEVQKIDDLNNKLITVEEDIYHLAKIENERAKKILLENKDKDMYDYEMHIELFFYTSQEEDEYGDPKEIYSWDHEPVYFKTFEEGKPFGINDKHCHNVSGSMIKNKVLNKQKHCWLLHRLYDDFPVSWKDILLIDGMDFEINVRFQYEKKL